MVLWAQLERRLTLKNPPNTSDFLSFWLPACVTNSSERGGATCILTHKQLSYPATCTLNRFWKPAFCSMAQTLIRSLEVLHHSYNGGDKGLLLRQVVRAHSLKWVQKAKDHLSSILPHLPGIWPRAICLSIFNGISCEDNKNTVLHWCWHILSRFNISKTRMLRTQT